MTMTKAAAHERPILFSTPMVQAILDGKKTQTRRVVKWKVREQGLNLAFSGLDAGPYANDDPTTGWVLRSRDGRGTWSDRTYPLRCPYGLAGGWLWVREKGWYDMDEMADVGVRVFYATGHMKFRRSGKCDWAVGGSEQVQYGHWEELLDMNGTLSKRPSIHMPRWASRLTLEIVGVRVERLQHITEKDAYEEGAPDEIPFAMDAPTPHKEGFRRLWDSINAKRGYGWDVNPWVWVVEFKV